MDETLIRVGIRATALTLRVQDVVLHLKGELMSVAIGTRAAIAQPLESAFLINDESCNQFYGRCQTPGKAPPSLRQRAPEPQTVTFHSSPNPPSKAFTPPQKAEKCNPCVRYDLLPMCRVAHLPSCSHRLLIDGCLLISPVLLCNIITHMRLFSIRGRMLTFHSHCSLLVTRFWTLNSIQNSYNNFHFLPCTIFKVMSSSDIF